MKTLKHGLLFLSNFSQLKFLSKKVILIFYVIMIFPEIFSNMHWSWSCLVGMSLGAFPVLISHRKKYSILGLIFLTIHMSLELSHTSAHIMHGETHHLVHIFLDIILLATLSRSWKIFLGSMLFIGILGSTFQLPHSAKIWTITIHDILIGGFIACPIIHLFSRK